MNIPGFPAPDAQGQIIIYPPKPLPVRMLVSPLLGVLGFSVFECLMWAKHDKMGLMIFGAPGILCLIWAAITIFARYRVVLDDEGVFGGSKVLGGRIAWAQVENIRLNPTRPGSVFASRMQQGPKGPYKIGACVSTLAPLSTEETAALLLRLARQHQAPVTRVTTMAEEKAKEERAPLWANLLILPLIAILLSVFFLRVHNIR